MSRYLVLLLVLLAAAPAVLRAGEENADARARPGGRTAFWIGSVFLVQRYSYTLVTQNGDATQTDTYSWVCAASVTLNRRGAVSGRVSLDAEFRYETEDPDAAIPYRLTQRSSHGSARLSEPDLRVFAADRPGRNSYKLGIFAEESFVATREVEHTFRTDDGEEHTTVETFETRVGCDFNGSVEAITRDRYALSGETEEEITRTIEGEQEPVGETLTSWQLARSDTPEPRTAPGCPAPRRGTGGQQPPPENCGWHGQLVVVVDKDYALENPASPVGERHTQSDRSRCSTVMNLYPDGSVAVTRAYEGVETDRVLRPVEGGTETTFTRQSLAPPLFPVDAGRRRLWIEWSATHWRITFTEPALASRVERDEWSLDANGARLAPIASGWTAVDHRCLEDFKPSIPVRESQRRFDARRLHGAHSEPFLEDLWGTGKPIRTGTLYVCWDFYPNTSADRAKLTPDECRRLGRTEGASL